MRSYARDAQECGVYEATALIMMGEDQEAKGNSKVRNAQRIEKTITQSNGVTPTNEISDDGVTPTTQDFHVEANNSLENHVQSFLTQLRSKSLLPKFPSTLKAMGKFPPAMDQHPAVLRSLALSFW